MGTGVRSFRPGQDLLRHLARLLIASENFLHGRWVVLGGCRQYLFNCTRYAGKWDVSFQKGLDGNLIGCVKCNAMSAATLGCLVSQPQAWKPRKVRLRE